MPAAQQAQTEAEARRMPACAPSLQTEPSAQRGLGGARRTCALCLSAVSLWMNWLGPRARPRGRQSEIHSVACQLGSDDDAGVLEGPATPHIHIMIHMQHPSASAITHSSLTFNLVSNRLKRVTQYTAYGTPEARDRLGTELSWEL